MGYPMTFRRFVNRNALTKGDYGDAGRLRLLVNTRSRGLIKTEEEFVAYLGPRWRDELERMDQRHMGLLGDLRRLEQDAVDENAIARGISTRTGIDVEVVAAVLNEFVNGSQ